MAQWKHSCTSVFLNTLTWEVATPLPSGGGEHQSWFPSVQNSSGIHEVQLWAQNTSLRHSRHEANNSLLGQPSARTYSCRLERNSVESTAQNHKCPQSRAWREFPLVDPVKMCTEIGMNNPNRLPSLQYTMRSVRRTRRRITSDKLTSNSYWRILRLEEHQCVPQTGRWSKSARYKQILKAKIVEF